MSNETINNIKSRRSIRLYKPEQIKKDEFNIILEAGMYAPSAANQQPWYFTVIQSKDIMSRMSQDTKDHFIKSGNQRFQQIASSENFHVFHNAPTAIIISGDEKAIMPQADCAAATQNMLIAAESLEIGSCWINIVIHLFLGEKSHQWKMELSIPEGYKPMYAVSLGYKVDKNIQTPPRRENTVNFIE